MRQGEAPLLVVFGGKITTYRRLAENALVELAPHLPALAAAPAGRRRAPLPGGDFPMDGDSSACRCAARPLPLPARRRSRCGSAAPTAPAPRDFSAMRAA